MPSARASKILSRKLLASLSAGALSLFELAGNLRRPVEESRPCTGQATYMYGPPLNGGSG
jgi:hypothetical protein